MAKKSEFVDPEKHFLTSPLLLIVIAIIITINSRTSDSRSNTKSKDKSQSEKVQLKENNKASNQDSPHQQSIEEDYIKNMEDLMQLVKKAEADKDKLIAIIEDQQKIILELRDAIIIYQQMLETTNRTVEKSIKNTEPNQQTPKKLKQY